MSHSLWPFRHRIGRSDRRQLELIAGVLSCTMPAMMALRDEGNGELIRLIMEYIFSVSIKYAFQ